MLKCTATGAPVHAGEVVREHGARGLRAEVEERVRDVAAAEDARQLLRVEEAGEVSDRNIEEFSSDKNRLAASSGKVLTYVCRVEGPVKALQRHEEGRAHLPRVAAGRRAPCNKRNMTWERTHSS